MHGSALGFRSYLQADVCAVHLISVVCVVRIGLAYQVRWVGGCS